MIHRLSENVLVQGGFNGALTNGTQNGNSVDTIRSTGGAYRRAAVVFNVTDSTSTFNYQIQDSADNSTWNTIAGGTLGSALAISQSNAPLIADVDLAKRNRWVRVQIIGTGAVGTVTATWLLYEGENTVGAAGTLQANPVISI